MNVGKFRNFIEYLWLYNDMIAIFGGYNSGFVEVTVAVPPFATNNELVEKHFSIFFSDYDYTYWRIHNLMKTEVSE